MAKQKFADVEIVIPGQFKGSSIIINGMDMSKFVTGVELVMDGSLKNNPTTIKIGFVANIRITGKAIIENEPD